MLGFAITPHHAGAGTAPGGSPPGEPPATPVEIDVDFPAIGEPIKATGGGASYQWFADGAPIAGATGPDFVPTNDELGAVLSVRSNASGAATLGTVMCPLPEPVLLDDLARSDRDRGSRRTIRGTTQFGVDGHAEALVTSTSVGTFGLDIVTGERLAPEAIGTVVWNVRTEPGSEAATVGRASQIYLSGAGGQVASGNEGAFDAKGRTIAFSVEEIERAAAAGEGTFKVRFFTNHTGGAGTAMRVWQPYLLAQGRPTALLRFHDSRVEAYTVAFPFMRDRGLVGTLHLAVDTIGMPNHLSWEQIEELSKAGWALALGTSDDRPWTGFATTDDAVADWRKGRAALAVRGLPLEGSVHNYWTSGSYDPLIADALTGAGVETLHGLHADTVHDRFGLIEGLRRNMPSRGSNASTTVAMLEEKLDEALIRGTTASYHFHAVTPEGSSIDIRQDVFEAFIERLAAERGAGNLDVLGVDTWWSRVRDAAPPQS